MAKSNSGIFFKTSAREKALIKQRMAQTGVRNMSAYIRKMCIDGYIVNLDIKQLGEISRLLRMISNNINQTAKRANETGSVYRQDVDDIRERLDSVKSNFGEVLESLAKIKQGGTSWRQQD